MVPSRTVPRVIDYPDGIRAIDTEMAGMTDLVAAYIVGTERPAIVETGPATVAGALVEGARAAGLDPAAVASLVVSHIHLDHAGGAGDLMDAFPNATVVVHSAGARHMVDPSKLMASAYRVFGDDLDRLFGPLAPVPADRLRAVDPGDTVDLGGGRRLEIVEATGHARHHLAVQDSETGALFVGDSMGVYMPETGVLRPATPPPDFNLDEAVATVRRFREREPSALYLTHFGPAPAERDMLEEAERRLVDHGRIVEEALRDTDDLDAVTEILKERTRSDYAAVYADPALEAKFEALNAFRSSAAGYMRYFQTRD